MAEDTFDGHDTRHRLLEAARDVFAEKGFYAATTREICERAEANVAAVNYYFSTKENLYAEAWRKSFHDALEKNPPDGGVPPQAPAEKRLRGRIKAMIDHVTDEENRTFRIAQKELAAPTRLLNEVQKECLRPLQQGMRQVVRELLGPAVPERQVRFAQASIAAQCFGLLHHIRMHREAPGAAPPPAAEIIADFDAYAEHVFRFSLAGLLALRDSFEGSGAAAAPEAPAEGTRF